MATIGTSGAPSQNTVNYDALLSTTLEAYRNVLADNIYKSNSFLSALKQYGGVVKQNGGERVKCPLMYEENGTVKSYSGYETLNMTPQDGITSAFYPWAEIGGSITISRKEERQNSGEAAMLDLLQAKIKQAEMSMKSAVNKMLVAGTVSSNTFVPGNNTKDILPLAYFLSKLNGTDPTAGGNVGNISRSNAWWKHVTAVADSATKDTGNSFALSVSTWAGVSLALRKLRNTCARGADESAPNLFLLDQGTYETYEAQLDSKIRYMDTKMADMGFDSLKLLNSTVIWDERVPNIDEGLAADDSAYATNNKQGTAFAINTQYMKLVVDSETDFTTTPFIDSIDQTAKAAKVLFMGQLTSNTQRKNGVLYALSGTIVS